MKVVIVGVLGVDHSSDVGVAWAFLKWGYQVVPFNYRSIIKKKGHEFFEELLVSFVEKERPELVLFCKCNGVNSRVVERCTRLTKTWLYNPDPIGTIQGCLEVIEHAKRATYSSCNGVGVVDWFKTRGVQNCRLLIQGYNPNIYVPVPAKKEYQCDVSFIGAKTASRQNFKDCLEKAQIKTLFFGPGFGPSVRNREYAAVCSSSRFVLSMNTYNDIPGYYSNRLNRILGCGSCVVHYDPTNTIGDFFRIGDELLAFRTAEELVSIVKTVDEETCKQIRKSAREKALKDCTVLSFVEKMLKMSSLEKRDSIDETTSVKDEILRRDVEILNGFMRTSDWSER